MNQSKIRTIFYTAAAVISLVGLAEATYLTVLDLTGATAVCGDSAGCLEVLGSPYAHVWRIPVAAFGALGYFSAFSFVIFAAFGYARARIFFTFTVLAMFAITLGLLYVQAFVLHAFCRYCLFSAALVFLLAALVVASPPAD